MLRRVAVPFILLAAVATPSRAQTLADARTCERAITGSAADRVALQRMVTAAPSKATGHFAAGCQHVITAKWDSAAIRFNAAASANPGSSATQLWLGNINGQLARIGDAATKGRLAPVIRAAYTRAITLDGGNVDAREGLMQHLLEVPASLGGDKGKAQEQALAIGKVNPFRGIGAQLSVASSRGDKAAVEKLLVLATTQFPDSLLGWANLSAVQADAQRASESFATIARWQARRTHAMFALFSLGRTAAVTGQQLERGEQALKQYLRGQRGPQDPPFANANYRLGQIYERQKRVADARAAYQLALNANPRMRDAQVALDRVK
ncbi:MAG TPA: tetratricopeptide repeat protein [Gemmatimonadaceae bacterium]|nr:tetratricopeptide repeat protein [Gemmatimonadaceae bacterium]